MKVKLIITSKYALLLGSNVVLTDENVISTWGKTWNHSAMWEIWYVSWITSGWAMMH